MIELIMVIVILGVVSVSAMSLFASKSTYTTFLAKDQFISSALLAQQTALAAQDAPTNPLQLCISQTASDWIMSVWRTTCNTGTLIQSQTVERGGATLVILTINADASTSTVTVSNGGSDSFSFNNLASLSVTKNYKLTFSGDSTSIVCLSSTGYAYEGDCES